MHDARLEDLLRQTLRDEGERLPLAISAGLLERRWADRRRARDKNRWLAAAAVALVAVGTTTAILAWVGRTDTTVTASPVPSVSASTLPTSTLPPPEALLSKYPEAVLLLGQSVGPADGPASPAPAESSAPLEIGTLAFDGPFVIALACLGGGEMVVEVNSPKYDIAYTSAVAECDGNPTYSEYAAPPIDPESTGDPVTVTVPAGRSWRLVIGTLPMSLIEPPDLAPIEGTDGWNFLADISATQLTGAAPRTGSRLAVPEAASRVSVFVQCAGVGNLSVDLGGEASEVPCDPDGSTQRLDFPVVGGEVVSLEASADQPGAWVRMIVETDARITTVYPSAPPMPAAVAAAPYFVPDANVVALGTIGGSEQTILPLGGALPGKPSGDLLPVGVSNDTQGASLLLVSIAGGEVLRTLASVPAPAFIIDSWADEPNGRVYYGLVTESGLEFRSVAVDGSDDRIVATVAREGLAGVTAELALDGSTFVVDACHAGSGCARTVLDTGSGDVRTIDRAADPICRILGIVDDVIIGFTRPTTCAEEASTALVAVPIDGEPRVILEDAPREVTDAVVVRTADGAKLVYVGSVADDGSAVTPAVLDVATGATTDLPPGDVGDPRLGPSQVALPDGWVLLAGGAMGDFPWQRALDRPAPVLVNLETGRRIELPNLPNWTGYLSGG